jgi:hypothetical protein
MWRISIGPSTRFGNSSACKAVLRRIKSPYSLHFIIQSFAKAFMGILPSFLAKGLLGSPSCHLFRRTYQFIFAACITLLLLWTPLGSVANLTLVLVELCTVGLFIGDCFSGRWLCRKNCGGRRGKGLDLSVRDPGIAITVKQVGKQDFQLLLPVLNHDELDLGTCSRSSKYICSCTRYRSGRQGSSQGFADRLIGDFARWAAF